MNKDFLYVLEEMVDAHGIRSILEGLSEIAYEKADHVLTNWQDKELAKAWSKIGAYLSKVSANKVIQDSPL